MKSKEQLLKDVFEIAKDNVSSVKLLEFLLEKGKTLSSFYHADYEVVFIGLCLMDIKLKEALAKGKREEHVAMSLEFALDFLNDYDITDSQLNKIINCIVSHHKEVPFQCIEAEICVNADCYLFLHPIGVFQYLNLWASRTEDLVEQVTQVKGKLDEKYQFLSLDKAKEELEDYYQMFRKLFDEII